MFCIRCGAQLDEKAAFCSNCGERVAQDPTGSAANINDTAQSAIPAPSTQQSGYPSNPAPVPAPAPKKRGKVGIVITIIAVILVIGLAVFLVKGCDGGSSSSSSSSSYSSSNGSSGTSNSSSAPSASSDDLTESDMAGVWACVAVEDGDELYTVEEYADALEMSGEDIASLYLNADGSVDFIVMGTEMKSTLPSAFR